MTGIPVDAVLLAGDPLPSPDDATDKNERGRVLVVGGGRRTPGAALLAGTAALRAGAGKVRLLTAASVATPLALALPEALVEGLPEDAAGEIAGAEALDHGGCDALLLGPGMLDCESACALAARILGKGDCGVVLDAAAIEYLKADGRLHRPIIATPNPGEMARLLGVELEEVAADPLAAGRSVAERFRCVLVMKGPVTHILLPEGGGWTYEGGGVGLATSGSGDVLAGIVAGLLARGAAPAQAARWGVFLHGTAGARLARRIGPVGFLARELLDELPGLMAELTPA